jgi:hypothetical protein
MATSMRPSGGRVMFQTCDVANGERAKDLAADEDLPLEVLFPKETRPSDALALVVDRDFLGLDAAGRREFLAGLSARPPAVLTAVISYDFADGEESGLKNVWLARRLDGDLFRRLASYLADPPDSGGEEFWDHLLDPTGPESLTDDQWAILRLIDDGCPHVE